MFSSTIVYDRAVQILYDFQQGSTASPRVPGDILKLLDFGPPGNQTLELNENS
jgi:hypothetical protein